MTQETQEKLAPSRALIELSWALFGSPEGWDCLLQGEGEGDSTKIHGVEMTEEQWADYMGTLQSIVDMVVHMDMCVASVAKNNERRKSTFADRMLEAIHKHYERALEENYGEEMT